MNNQVCNQGAGGPSAGSTISESKKPASMASVAHNAAPLSLPIKTPDAEVILVESLPPWFRKQCG